MTGKPSANIHGGAEYALPGRHGVRNECSAGVWACWGDPLGTRGRWLSIHTLRDEPRGQCGVKQLNGRSRTPRPGHVDVNEYLPEGVSVRQHRKGLFTLTHTMFTDCSRSHQVW